MVGADGDGRAQVNRGRAGVPTVGSGWRRGCEWAVWAGGAQALGAARRWRKRPLHRGGVLIMRGAHPGGACSTIAAPFPP